MDRLTSNTFQLAGVLPHFRDITLGRLRHFVTLARVGIFRAESYLRQLLRGELPHRFFNRCDKTLAPRIHQALPQFLVKLVDFLTLLLVFGRRAARFQLAQPPHRVARLRTCRPQAGALGMFCRGCRIAEDLFDPLGEHHLGCGVARVVRHGLHHRPGQPLQIARNFLLRFGLPHFCLAPILPVKQIGSCPPVRFRRVAQRLQRAELRRHGRSPHPVVELVARLPQPLNRPPIAPHVPGNPSQTHPRGSQSTNLPLHHFIQNTRPSHHSPHRNRVNRKYSRVHYAANSFYHTDVRKRPRNGKKRELAAANRSQP
ncbi:hypothetical protein [Aeoliella sp.]|uniref:hypothetical protein n=1 Tax=Aeoliella sp. TaxID=2795800 RepID=UPI003CCBA0EB